MSPDSIVGLSAQPREGTENKSGPSQGEATVLKTRRLTLCFASEK